MSLLQPNDINAIVNALNANTSIFKQCNVFGESENLSTEYINKSSASLSDVIKTRVTNPTGSSEVFLKLWFGWDKISKTGIRDTLKANRKLFVETIGEETFYDYEERALEETYTTSLYYERKMYEYITKTITERGISPNFITMMASNTCKISDVVNSLKASKDFGGKTTLLKKFGVMKTLFPKIDLNFIMTESIGQMSVHTFLSNIKSKHTKIQKSEFWSLIFQFFYIFYVMHEFKIIHNDNHLQNVMVQILDSPTTLDITVGDFNVKFTTSLIVKIYDWDHGYCPHIGVNPILKNITRYRILSTFTRGRDFSTFICFFSSLNIPEIDEIIKKLIKGPIPTLGSNTEEIRIKNGVTKPLLNWIDNNREKITSTMFITIGKTDLESLVSKSTIDAIRKKLGRDKYKRWVYDGENITNIYLGISGTTLVIPEGWTCHPIYDSNDLDVVKYFETKKEFDMLCEGLDKTITSNVNKYVINKNLAKIPAYMRQEIGLYIPADSSELPQVVGEKLTADTVKSVRASPVPIKIKKTPLLSNKDCKRACPPGKECNRASGRCKNKPKHAKRSLSKRVSPKPVLAKRVSHKRVSRKPVLPKRSVTKKAVVSGKDCKRACPPGKECNRASGRCKNKPKHAKRSASKRVSPKPVLPKRISHKRVSRKPVAVVAGKDCKRACPPGKECNRASGRCKNRLVK